MTWYTAVKTCLMHGAELASITDQYHQSFLTVILNRLGRPHWIGLFTADVGILNLLEHPCLTNFKSTPLVVWPLKLTHEKNSWK